MHILVPHYFQSIIDFEVIASFIITNFAIEKADTIIEIYTTLEKKSKLYSKIETKKLALNYIEMSKVALTQKSDKLKVEKYIQLKERTQSLI